MSRSRDFSLARAYFFPREGVILATPNIPIECMFCKNFYTFHSCFLCIWFATKLRAKCGKCRFAPQKMQIFKQKCRQNGKILFPDFVQEMGEKIHGNGILDAETRKKDEEKAFLAQVENFPHITEIQRIMQNYIHF